VVVLVDGDGAGDNYVKALLTAPKPPDHVVQWPTHWLIEDVVGWILAGEEELAKQVQAERSGAPASTAEMVQWLKTPTKEGGAKTDLLAYEAVAGAILTSATAKGRARALLGAFSVLKDDANPSGLLQLDSSRTTSATSVWRFVL